MILNLAFALGYACHVLACCWVLVGRSTAQAGADSWFAYELKGPYSATSTGDPKHSSSIYIAAFYFCLTTFTSVRISA